MMEIPEPYTLNSAIQDTIKSQHHLIKRQAELLKQFVELDNKLNRSNRELDEENKQLRKKLDRSMSIPWVFFDFFKPRSNGKE